MIYLTLVFFLLFHTYYAQVAKQCRPFSVACSSDTCTDAFNGAEVTVTDCPFVAFQTTTERQCLACKAGYTCVSGNCERNDDVFPGKVCANDDQCRPFIPDITRAPLSCDGGNCVLDLTGLLYPNDAGCTSNADCIDDTTCSAGTCIEVGAGCTDDIECLGTNWCNMGLCVARVPGGLCTESRSCGGGEVCVNGRCTTAFIRNLDIRCNTDDIAKNISCGTGLQCVNNPLSSRAECQISPLSNNACDITRVDQCAAGTLCTCDLDSGRGACTPIVEDGRCANQFTAYYNCQFASACRRDVPAFIFPGTCLYENCFRQWSSLQTCRYTTIRDVYSRGTCEVSRLAQQRSGNEIVPFEPTDDNNPANVIPMIF